MKIPKAKAKRGTTGAGHLFKRGTDGKSHPADWNGQGRFWIAYRVGGKLIRQRLLDADGNPITMRDTAEAERKRILAPLQTGNEVATLDAIKNRLEAATRKQAEAVAEAKGGIRIVDAWSGFLANKQRPDTGDATLRQYKVQWDRFASWLAEKYPEVKTIDGVNRKHAEAFAAAILDAGRSTGTFNKYLRLLTLVFRVLGDDAGIEINPFSRDKLARRRSISAERRELTPEELRRIITTADDSMKLLYAIGCYSGLRLGDCCTLRWSEIDFDRELIIRIPNKTAVRGKPVRVPLSKDLFTMLVDARRSARGEYILPEFAGLYIKRGADIISRRIQRHFVNCGIDVHAPGTGFQIRRDALGNPETGTDGNVVLEQTGKRAVIRCGFHSLRHTFVSLNAKAGTPLSVVQDLVGHSNPAMTRHYTHTGDAEAVRAIAALPALNAVEPIHSETREPLPAWARELISSMDMKTWKRIKAELIEAKG